MPLTSLQLQNFTAFAELDLAFSPGVNILVGENGTGKTHVMKVCSAPYPPAFARLRGLGAGAAP